MTYYIYILYSKQHNKYYTGYTTSFETRLEQHNTSTKNTFTSKYRPWKILAVFNVGKKESNAITTERYIKKQKSRNLLIKLGDPEFVPNGKLAHMVRVPHVRD
jgi:putative endonuclease